MANNNAITPKELHERNFMEMSQVGIMPSGDSNCPEKLYANYAIGCVLCKNGNGYIPYINMTMLSSLEDGQACVMISDVAQLDDLIKSIKNQKNLISLFSRIKTIVRRILNFKH